MICTQCQAEGDENTHYSYKVKDGTKLHLKCKKCYNSGYVKKLTGFSRLPEEQQARIRILLVDRKNKMKDIAEQERIPYTSLLRWFKKMEL